MTDFAEKVRIPGCRATQATDKAVHVVFPDGAERWVPQSVIDDDSEVWKAGGEGVLVVSKWYADRKGIG